MMVLKTLQASPRSPLGWWVRPRRSAFGSQLEVQTCEAEYVKVCTNPNLAYQQILVKIKLSPEIYRKVIPSM